MVKVILSGCNGHMGQVLTDILNADSETVIAAGIDIAPANNVREYPIFSSPADCSVEADAVIDFSNFRATDALLDFCVDRRLPLVLCTTALTEETLAKVAECSKIIPILRSANMSVGINLLMKIVKEAAALLAPAGYDMEIVEAHHNRKIDAPSGTALALGESMNEALDNEYHFVFGRHDRHEKRDPKEIGISSVRAAPSSVITPSCSQGRMRLLNSGILPTPVPSLAKARLRQLNSLPESPPACMTCPT